MDLRRLEPHEVSLHRELRLRALQEAPDSFGETFADVVARPSSYWEDLTRSVTEPGRHVMFLAYEGQNVLGSTYGLRERDQSQVGRVGGMWVEPAWRRRGVGRALLQQVFTWAREHGLSRLGLWAPSHSPGALALYYQAGFRETGRRRALPTNPMLQILKMEALVSDSGHETVEQAVSPDAGPAPSVAPAAAGERQRSTRQRWQLSQF